MNTNSKAKRILCYGDSNTWGWVPSGMGMKRHSIKERWTGILQKLLGENYEIIEEGLAGRTTMFDDPRPEFPERNALKTLPIILETHLPLDLVILMLGTNDTKEMFKLSTEKITKGIQKLVRTIKAHKILEGTSAPKILIVVPPIIDETTDFASNLFKGGYKKTKDLVVSYKKLAENEDVLYINPNTEIKVDEEEGIHIDITNHKKLAELIYEAMKLWKK
jgi:lysophospholipase L1-like esterase